MTIEGWVAILLALVAVILAVWRRPSISNDTYEATMSVQEPCENCGHVNALPEGFEGEAEEGEAEEGEAEEGEAEEGESDGEEWKR